MNDQGRRRLLGAVGSGVLGALAGCTELFDRDGGTGTTPDSGGQGTTEDWPLVGRTPTNRLFDDDGVATTGDVEVAWGWSYDVPDGVGIPNIKNSGPVVVDGVVYTVVTGTYTPPDTSIGTSGDVDVNEVVGLDAETGARVELVPFQKDEDLFAGAAVPPAVADDRLFVPHLGLFAHDLASGDRLWTAPDAIALGPATATEDDLYLRILLDDGSALVAFDAADGSEQWHRDCSLSNYQPPAVTAETLYVSEGPEVVAVDRTDGNERWRTNAGVDSHVLARGQEDATPVSGPVVGEDAVYVAGGKSVVANRDAGALVALDRESGETQWSFQPEPSRSGRYSVVGGMPALHDGTLYVTGAFVERTERTPDTETRLYAIDAADGSLEWETSASGLAGYVVGSGDSVLVVNETGVATHAAADGTRRGSQSSDDRRPYGLTVNAVSDGRVFTKDSNGVVAYEFG